MRSVAYMTITCDRCRRYSETVELCEIAGGRWDARYVDEELEERGWLVTSDGDICPNCKEKVEASG